MTKEKSLEFILKHKIVAVLRHIHERDILRLAGALFEGGISVFEITFTNENAVRLIEILKREFKEKALVGAGTITKKPQLISSLKAGSEFFVSPFFDRALVSFAIKNHALYV